MDTAISPLASIGIDIVNDMADACLVAFSGDPGRAYLKEVFRRTKT
jgi:hypothetical protein